MYILENERLRVAVSEKGAELQNLYDKQNNWEWLWQGDTAWWGKRAPFLFPFVGALKDGTYRYAGKTYAMTKHGFARDMTFIGEQVSESSLRFTLSSSPETLAMYPFDFELSIIYTLESAGLAVDLSLKNQGAQPMIFAIGGHPAFNCPMDLETWSIQFEKEEVLESSCIDLSTGLILPSKKAVPLDRDTLPLKSALFAEDALVFEQLNSKRVTLKGSAPWQHLQFDFHGFPLFALWSPQGPFVCLEPWVGMADLTNASGELTEKYGMQTLAGGAVYGCGYWMGV